jgi:hypothetical protein
LEEGDGEVERVVNLTLASSTDTVASFFIDAVEAPAGLTFNPATPAATKLKATTPGP